jgi:hypothetical protein
LATLKKAKLFAKQKGGQKRRGGALLAPRKRSLSRDFAGQTPS